MNKKVLGVLAYIHIIGWIIALALGGLKEAKMHMNQGLVLWILSVIGGIISFIPLVGGIIAVIIQIICLVGMVMGVVYAVTDKDEPLPIIGSIQIIK